MNRNGFAPILIVGIIAVLAIASFIGYSIWKSSQAQPQSRPAVSSSTNLTPTAATSPATTSAMAEQLRIASDATVSSVIAALTDWGLYTPSSSYQLTPDQGCPSSTDPQFAAYISKVNGGEILGKVIDGDLILYTPNEYSWTRSQVDQKYNGSFCEAHDPAIYHVYPDKLIWGFGCGGGYDPVCMRADSIIRNYFYNPTSSTAATSPAMDVCMNTSTWQTYRNAQYGFSFEYPTLGSKQRVVDIPAGPYTHEEISVQYWSNQDDQFVDTFDLLVSTSTGKISLQDWFEANVDDASGTLLRNDNFIPEQVPGNGSAYVLNNLPILDSYSGGPVADAYLMDPNRHYVFAFGPSQVNDLGLYCPGNEGQGITPFVILSTLQFSTSAALAPFMHAGSQFQKLL